MYSSDRQAYRRAYFTAWLKYKNNLPLETVEAQMVEVILTHPEYHALLETEQAAIEQEFALEENPFFHMSLHITINEQMKLDRPPGIALLYTTLLTKHQDAHALQHEMITCLAQTLWQAHQTNTAPDEADYLEKLRAL